jgi:hypothetical protein
VELRPRDHQTVDPERYVVKVSGNMAH